MEGAHATACYLDEVQVGTHGERFVDLEGSWKRPLCQKFLELKRPACRAGVPMLDPARGRLQFSSLTDSASPLGPLGFVFEAYLVLKHRDRTQLKAQPGARGRA